MNMAVRIIVDICLLGGCFFALAGVVGMLRMPDVFCRMQSSTNIATLGLLGIVVAGIVYAIGAGMAASTVVKLVLVGLLVLLSNPIASHALCKAAYKRGELPEKKMVCDDYKKEEDDEH